MIETGLEVYGDAATDSRGRNRDGSDAPIEARSDGWGTGHENDREVGAAMPRHPRNR
jgi:hypothetical protein